MKDLTYQAWERTMDAKELTEAQDENRSSAQEELEAQEREFFAQHFVFGRVG